MRAFALILLTIVVSSQAQSDPRYCYSTDASKPQRSMFSTKTAYEQVRGRSINPNVSSECEKGLFLSAMVKFNSPLNDTFNQFRLQTVKVLDVAKTRNEIA